MRSRPRLLPDVSVRTRLTAWYGLVFFVSGASLVAINHALTERGLRTHLADTAFSQVVHQHWRSTEVDGVVRSESRGVSVEPVDDRLASEIAEATQRAREAALADLLDQSLVALAVAGVLAVAIGWLMAGRALRPLSKVTAHARRVAERSLHERVALTGPRDEIRELADTFDDMLERLDRAFDGQRRFVANASHELRTPLAVNRALIEYAVSDADADERMSDLGGQLLEVNARQERLIEGLLMLARSDRTVEDPRPVDLGEVLSRVAGRVEGTAELAGVRFTVSPAAAPVLGDPVLLEQLVTNLVHNGIRHNHSGGWLDVRTATVGADVELVAGNSGPVVRAEDLPRLFEPFRRGQPERTDSHRGAGIGLSIVRSVARAHRGTVDASPRRGGGLTVRLRLPAAGEGRGRG
ncbi:sensor histidine kinase [Actinoalloteichus caeruleus]|uniref:sensor histidine kinase n=2 Tax=Actinoalloteichus cyanogriseus TaxID=2893586 RepID=UPI0004C06CE1|nr:ATP-binding protein [Actinoalloteichus caeruleus]